MFCAWLGVDSEPHQEHPILVSHQKKKKTNTG
jgi:hypothetical protein